MALTPFSDDLRRARAQRNARRAPRTATQIAAHFGRYYTPPKRKHGKMDISSLTCECVCHMVIGSRRSREPTLSVCDHCRRYG